MGITAISARVFNPVNPSAKVDLTFTVDSGAVYSLVPENVLQALRIEPHTIKSFFLFNGEEIRRKMGDAAFEYLGEITFAPVIFGEDGDAALMGVTTLGGFGLLFDPFRRELRPMMMRL